MKFLALSLLIFSIFVNSARVEVYANTQVVEALERNFNFVNPTFIEISDLIVGSEFLIGADSSGGGRFAPTGLKIQFHKNIKSSQNSIMENILDEVVLSARDNQIKKIYFKENQRTINFCIEFNDYSFTSELYTKASKLKNNEFNIEMILKCYKGSEEPF